MRRVPEVLDCWFESGSMPFAQVHYPFDNAEWFEHHYPGDFIVEYNGQTRGWFYTLHVLATALFDRPAFRSCLAHGIVLGDDGLKMSKSKGNYPEVTEVFNRDGSDAMRWFLMASPILRGGNLIVTEQGIREAARQALLPLWNSWYFLTLYANAADVEGRWQTGSEHVLDRYVLAKLHDCASDVTARMDRYDIAGACASVRGFCDVLTNWYVRRSRDRFWAGEQDAIDTLHTVLEVSCRLAAPLLPLTTEAIWRGLTGQRSVHLADWPDPALLPQDRDLVASMDRVRQVVSAVLSLRKARGLRVRQPLPQLTVAAPDAGTLAAFTDLIADEVNPRGQGGAVGTRSGRGRDRSRYPVAGRRVHRAARRRRPVRDSGVAGRVRVGGAGYHGHPGAGRRGHRQGPGAGGATGPAAGRPAGHRPDRAHHRRTTSGARCGSGARAVHRRRGTRPPSGLRPGA
jgi:isoleucyl-tRNA synthetase